MRIVLATGKGGVGKTTVAAATALACADHGQRVLALSTDAAHSLADTLDVPLGDQPGQVTDHLWAVQLDARARLERSWGAVRDWLLDALAWAGVSGIEAEELAVVPGLDEVFALTDVCDAARTGRWDVIVVDCGPTAETIRLLSLPHVLRWYMARLFPMTRRVNRIVGPVVGRLSNAPVAGEEVFDAAEDLAARLAGAQALLADPAVTSIRLVVNPERVVVAEARRTHTYLSLFGYAVDAVVVNRVLPDAVVDPWFASWKEAHREHLAEIETGFAPLPILEAPLAPAEVVGIDRLRTFGAALLTGTAAEHEPAASLAPHTPLRSEAVGAERHLVLDLPFASRDDVEVHRLGDEVFVRLGPYRRAIVLPDTLVGLDLLGAGLRDGALRVRFAPREPR